MKRIIFAMAIMAAGLAANAQYKKASFLTKGGRTYDIGAAGRFMSGDHEPATGILFSYGKDKGKNRGFHWFDLELVLPTKFSVPVFDYNLEEKVNITGKTTLSLIWRYNYAYYLMDNTNEDNKFLPFVTAGVSLVVAGNSFKEDESNYNYSYEDVLLYRSGLSYGANIGLGAIYNASQTIGFKVTGGYNYQGNFSNPDDYAGLKRYYPYESHPYVTLGIRFKLNEDND